MARPSHIYINGFWDRVDNEIYKQNMTKKEIAKRCRFDRKILSSYNNMSLPYFARLCAELSVSADYLLFGRNHFDSI